MGLTWLRERGRGRERGNYSERIPILFEHRRIHSSNLLDPYKTVFVANLPQNLDSYGIAGIFSKAGTVTDVSIPFRQGRRVRYGFVCFQDHESTQRSIRTINGKMVRGFRLVVQEAKPSRRHHYPESRKATSKWIYRRKTHSHFGEPKEVKESVCKSERRKEKGIISLPMEEAENLRSFNGESNSVMLTWLINSLVCESEASVDWEDTFEKLKFEVPGLIRVANLQWNKVILQFKDEDLADKALVESQILIDMFSSIRKWSWFDCAEERPVWIEICGIPPIGWKKKNFMDIAGKWGYFVFMDDNLEGAVSYESLEVLIITKVMKKIEEEFWFNLKEGSFRVCVKEVYLSEKKLSLHINKAKSPTLHSQISPEESEVEARKRVSNLGEHIRPEAELDLSGELVVGAIATSPIIVDSRCASLNKVDTKSQSLNEDSSSSWDIIHFSYNQCEKPLGEPIHQRNDKINGSPFKLDEKVQDSKSILEEAKQSLSPQNNTNCDSTPNCVYQSKESGPSPQVINRLDFQEPIENSIIALNEGTIREAIIVKAIKGKGLEECEELEKEKRSIVNMDASNDLEEPQKELVTEDLELEGKKQKHKDQHQNILEDSPTTSIELLAKESIDLGNLLGAKVVGNVAGARRRITRSISKQKKSVLEQSFSEVSLGSQSSD